MIPLDLSHQPLPRRCIEACQDDMHSHRVQTTHTKGADIEALLQRLSTVNDSMTSTLSGSSDVRLHTLGRHRDLLHDYNQVQRLGLLHPCSRRPAHHEELRHDSV